MSKKISKQYNKFAENFSSIHIKENRVNRKDFFNLFDFSLQNKKLLDIGCGDGSDLEFYQKKGAEIYGLDASEEMISLAENKLPSADLNVGIFEKIPYKERYFDIVASKYALQTSKSIGPIYMEVARVLKKNGIFIFLVVHPFRQFIEKKRNEKDYFKQEIVDSVIFSTKLVVKEPTHTLNEYFSSFFFSNFEVISFVEKYDPAAEKIDNDIYPGFMIVKARRK